jgi:hypothetical protein
MVEIHRDTPIEKVLSIRLAGELDSVVVFGTREDGSGYLASSGNLRNTIKLLKLAMECASQMEEIEGTFQ